MSIKIDINEDSAVEYFTALLKKADDFLVSDIHLRSSHNGDIILSMRKDGLLTPPQLLPQNISDNLFGRIKYLAKMKTYQDNFPQDGRISAEDAKLEYDIRVSTYPTVDGEKIVIRFFRKAMVKNLDKLGMSSGTIKTIKQFLNGDGGMLLLTGPAGSGKTTTIYACLTELAKSAEKNIITIEDPVEQVLPNIMQTEINPAMDLTYPNALRYLLRQDPEVIVIGEIRDEETAKIAVRSAFTGHKVIATLHAGSCKGVIERLFDMCDDKYSVLSSLKLILNQRLLRTKCHDCDGKGCEKCLNTGYSGRVPVVEQLSLNDDIISEIRKNGLDIVKTTKN